MSSFTFADKAGREWDLSISIKTAMEIDKSNFKLVYDREFSFLAPDKEMFTALMTKPSFKMAVIWAIIQSQVRRKFVDGIFVFGRWAEPRKEQHGDQTVVMQWTPEERKRDLTLAFSDTISDEDPFMTYADLAQNEFIANIGGDQLQAADEAFWRSLGDFFPQQRTALSTLLRQYNRARGKIDETIQNLEKEMEQTLDQALEKDVQNLRDQVAAELGKT